MIERLFGMMQLHYLRVLTRRTIENAVLYELSSQLSFQHGRRWERQREIQAETLQDWPNANVPGTTLHMQHERDFLPI